MNQHQFPASTRIAQILQQRIAQGHYSTGAWLPAERDLAIELSVSRPVVRTAISYLLERGLIVREPGCRPRVNTPVPAHGSQEPEAWQPGTARDMIAVIIPQRPTYMSAHAIQCGIGHVLQQKEAPYHLTVFDTYPTTPALPGKGEQEAREQSILDRIERADPAGLIIWHLVEAETLPILQRLQQKGTPVVFVDRCPTGFDCDYVGVDNRAATREAVEYLLDRGHRRIGYVTSSEQASTVWEREEGYREALQSRSVAPVPELLFTNPFEIGANMEPAFRHLSSLAEPPTAVVTLNDLFAFGFIREAQAHGWRVPEDISVIGFDDIESYSPHPAILTTVRQPFYQIGQRAAELLLHRLAMPESATKCTYQHTLLSTSLVVRSTTRPL